MVKDNLSLIDIIANYLKENEETFFWDALELIGDLKPINYKPQSGNSLEREIYICYNLILKHNKALIDIAKNKNLELKASKERYRRLLESETNPIEIHNEIPQEKEITIPSPIKLNVGEYINKILRVSNVEEIDSVLPSKSLDDYSTLIKTVIIKLKMELVAVRQLLQEATDAVDISELLNQRTLLVDSINYIINSNKEEIEIDETNINNHVNDIWYLTSTFGTDQNCYFLGDLTKRIPLDYYQTFSNLLEKLKRGYSRNDRNISGFEDDEDLEGILKIKHANGARIYFMPLSKGNIVIIAAYLKKEMKSRKLREFLVNRREVYKSLEQLIKTNLENESFIASQQLIDAKIQELLPTPIEVERAMING